MDISGISWEQVLRKLGIAYKKRSTAVLVALCSVGHEEKTPSCHFWPSGRFKCHGCCLAGDMVFFVRRSKFGPVHGDFSGEVEDFFKNLPPLPDTNTPDLPFSK